MTILFYSGIGGGGRESWPNQADDLTDEPTLFVDPNIVPGGPATHAEHLLAQASDGLHIVGHSYGGIAPVLTAALAPDRVRSLALFEPSCIDLGRGVPAIESGIALARRVWEEDASSDLSDGRFAARLFAAVHGNDDPGEEYAPAMGRNLRRWGPPWVHKLDPSVFSRTPTLVMTGGWDPGFEAIAAAMVKAGARHEVLPGFGHEPQKHPDANGLLREFWAGV